MTNRGAKGSTTVLQQLHLFGRHRAYANGAPRDLLRGWVYFALVIALARLLPAADLLHPLQSRIARVFQVMFAVGSVFHLVPFATTRQFSFALSADLVAINAGFTVQTATWLGARHPVTLVSALAAATIVGSAAHALWLGRDVQRAHRALKLGLGLFQVLQLSAVEAACVPGLALRAALVAAKALSFAYFLGVVRIESSSAAEAAAPSALWARAAVWPGVWGAHDNFHVQVLAIQFVQIYALGLAMAGRAAAGLDASRACLPGGLFT